jgi:membrane protease YdiL (CAAX protease family)
MGGGQGSVIPSDISEPLASDPQLTPIPERAPTAAERLSAFAEVLICSDYPTQLVLGSALALAGYSPLTPAGGLDIQFVVLLSFLDTIALIGLILLFLRAHGERPRDVLIGDKPIVPEAISGLLLSVACVGITIAVLLTIQLVAPSLHTVDHNPLEDLIGTPRNILIFGVVVVIAGGVREEVQRAFLLHRFDRWLGGGTIGVIVVSVSFGLGHLLQGVDAAIATGLLGAFWGVIYLRRRSAIAPIVSHSSFNLLQIGQFLLGR